MFSKDPVNEGKLPREANYVGQRQSVQLTGKQRRRVIHKEKVGSEGIPAHLSSSQFEPMNAIKRAYAIDTAGTVGKNLIPLKRQQVAEGKGDTEDYDLLRDTMRSKGVKAIPPVHVGTVDQLNRDYGGKDEPGMPGISHLNSLHMVGKGDALALGNGGHRTAIAADLGWKVMPVTHDKMNSGYGNEEFMKDPDEPEWSAEHVPSSDGNHDIVQHDPSGGMRYQPGARSYVPGNTGEADPGARWHAHGRDAGYPPGEGLYSRLHPLMNAPAAGAPLSANLNQQQFSASRQDVLPGMRRTLPRMEKPSLSQALAQAMNGQKRA